MGKGGPECQRTSEFLFYYSIYSSGFNIFTTYYKQEWDDNHTDRYAGIFHFHFYRLGKCPITLTCILAY